MFDGTTAFKLFSDHLQSGASAINSSGQVAGTSQLGGHNSAFMYDGTVHYLGTLGGPGSTRRTSMTRVTSSAPRTFRPGSGTPSCIAAAR